MADNDRLTQAVNQSGFPLQVAVAARVSATSAKHGWAVLHTEHAWRGEDGDGFIDLILERRARDLLLVVECKRVQDSEWVFLIPDDQLALRRQAKAWVTHFNDGQYRKFDWEDVTGEPQALQSGFCVVHGQDQKATPMLERIGGTLVASTEAYAREEHVLNAKKRSDLRVYFNVVVTTAKLKVCTFDPKAISIPDGKIVDPKYQDVPYIRFRKQLSTRGFESKVIAPDITESGRAKENTIFVVNADGLEQFLSKFDIDN